MKQAVIDIGSNSMRLTVYETTETGSFTILFKDKVMAGLAGYVEDGNLSLDGIARAVLGLLSFRNTLEALSIAQVSVFATASLRNIRNTEQAVNTIQRATGFSIEVISGEEEARYGYAGAMEELDLADGVFVDIGGASTEVVRFAKGKLETADSCPVGSLKLYRDWVKKILPNREAIGNMEQAIRLATVPGRPETGQAGVPPAGERQPHLHPAAAAGVRRPVRLPAGGGGPDSESGTGADPHHDPRPADPPPDGGGLRRRGDDCQPIRRERGLPMSKDSQGVITDYSYTQNRELSWLRFNRRVLEEGADDTVPTLERMKFISIFTSNLDEFFMVRVGSLVDMASVSPKDVDNKSGMGPKEQLAAIQEVVPGLIEIKGQLFRRVSALLAQEGIVDLEYADLTDQERVQVDDYFRSAVLPILSPQIVGQRHPSPHLDNKALYVTALLSSKSGKKSLGFIPLPAALPPIFLLPGSQGRFLRLENIIRHWAPKLFGKYTVEETCVISATRNADLSFDGEKFEDREEDFRQLMTKMLKKRANQAIVRLELGQKPSQTMMDLLTAIITVVTGQIYYDSSPLAGPPGPAHLSPLPAPVA